MAELKKPFSKSYLRLSDLFLVIGLAPFIVFLCYGQLFMQHINPNEVGLKLHIIIPLFVLLLISWSIYIYLEIKHGVRLKINIACLFIFAAIWGLVSILIQPVEFEINMIKSVTWWSGQTEIIGFNISTTHRMFFAFDLISIILFIYIGFFIFPYRFISINFIKYIGYAAILLGLIVIFYSYITEYDKYIPFLKALLAGKTGKEDEANVYQFAITSFIIHRNAFGMMMMISIIFCVMNYSLSKKIYYLFLAIYFFISEIFSYCKTSLLISSVILFLFITYTLISTYNKHRKRSQILLILFAFSLATIICLFTISYLSGGVFLEPLYSFINSFTKSTTIEARLLIWNNVYQLLYQKMIYFFFGRGFGLINEMLLPMNLANGDTPMSFPTHSAYLNLLAEGGIVYLLLFLLLLGYYLYITIKCYKRNKCLTIVLFLGVFAFLMYSLIETIHYIAYLFMLPVFIYHRVLSLNE